MRRLRALTAATLLVAACLTLGLNYRAQAQSFPNHGGGAGGSGAASSCALWDATSTLSSDTGCVWTGTAGAFTATISNLVSFVYTVSAGGWESIGNFGGLHSAPASTVADFYNQNGRLVTMEANGAEQAFCNNLGQTSTSFTPGSTGSDLTAWTLSVPANAMANAGAFIRIRAWGSRAATANTTTFKVKFGATTVATGAVTSATATAWIAEADVNRNAAATQVAIGNVTATSVAPLMTTTAPAETVTAAVTVLITINNATTAGDSTFLGGLAFACK